MNANIYINGKLVHTVIGYKDEREKELRIRVWLSLQVTVDK